MRIENESEKAFAYYEKYRDMPPPRIVTALLTVELNGKTPAIRTLRQWKKDFGWDARCREHDFEILNRAQERSISERVAQLHELLETETEIIRCVRNKVFTGIQNLQDDEVDVHKLYTLVRSWDIARIWLQESIDLVNWIETKTEKEKTDA